MNDITYAVVDRSIEPTLLDKVDEYETKAWCLFPAPVDEEFAQVAPYLVVVNDALQAWLLSQVKPWGFFFLSSTPVQLIRTHFRALMDGIIEDTEQRLFLRYYDPRILWALLDGFDNVRLNHFLGPIDRLQTHFPQAKETDFAQQRANFRPFGYITPRPLLITQAQYQQVLVQCQQNLVAEVAALIIELSVQFGGTTDSAAHDFSQQLVQHCIDWGISVSSHIKSVAQWCARINIREWSRVPESWLAILADTQYPADYRIMSLQSQIRTHYGL